MHNSQSFETDIVAIRKRSMKNNCPSVHRIPSAVWAHLEDQKSGYIVEEGLLAAIGPPQILDSEAYELGATLTQGRETANPVSCSLIVSSKCSVPSLILHKRRHCHALVI